ncbi:hypothetical protein DFH07DRAFT_955699 [Mycena maculata]|uniref:Uncharacterized protein n=1 Tax=Mycena maculata TaxID=230809 RepID=A0AAD7JMB5_9AGAR|nr:hypothetical protein DFH07DRAFT_955699 [Mycena maculata]
MPTSCSNLPLPLPVDFDCDAYATHLDDRLAPDGMEVEDKNTANVILEASNKASITLTCAYATAHASSAGVGSLDISAPLQGLQAYTEKEKAMLLYSPELVVATGPLLLSLTKLIAQHRTTTAMQREKEHTNKEAEKSKASQSLLGSMVFTHPHEIDPILKQLVVIPPIFLVSLGHKVNFPLYWWTDGILRKAAKSPHMIVKELSSTEQMATYSIADKVQVVDVTKCAKLFDGEDESKNLTPSWWHQAAKNLLSAFQQLCPAVDPLDPTTRNYASEFASHFTWFWNIACFDTQMDLWLPVELKMHCTILAQGLFSSQIWADELCSVLRAHKAQAAATAAPAASAVSAPPSAGVK